MKNVLYGKKILFVLLIILTLFLQPLSAAEIHEAVIRSDPNKVCYLIENNPELIESKNSTGFTPLELAAIQENRQYIGVEIEEKSVELAQELVASEINSHAN